MPRLYPLAKWGSKLAGAWTELRREREDGRDGVGQGLRGYAVSSGHTETDAAGTPFR